MSLASASAPSRQTTLYLPASADWSPHSVSKNQSGISAPTIWSRTPPSDTLVTIHNCDGPPFDGDIGQTPERVTGRLALLRGLHAEASLVDHLREADT
jgi:hypothetical protein